jgi:hypothetical protein
MGLINQAGLFSGAGLVDRAGLYNEAGLYVPGSFSGLATNPVLAYEAESSMLADGGVPAAQGDGISTLDDLTANSIDATQTTATHQPIAFDAANGGPFARFDGSNDRMSFTLAESITNGTVFFATKKGSYAANLNLAAGTHDFSGNKISDNYVFSNDLVALYLFDYELSETQIAERKSYFVTKGAVEDYGSETDFFLAWFGCSSLTSFPLIDTSSGTNFGYTWFGCSSLTSFPLIDTSSGTSFREAWHGCSSLTSFPLIDTSSGINFFTAWSHCSSLTSFPLIDTSSGTNFSVAWSHCSSLTSFPLIDTSSGTNFGYTWFGCSSLEDFPAGFFDNWNPSSIINGVFNLTWDGCSSLTSQSVENILTSIDASGIWATNDGTSSGTTLNDPVIDIDYDVSTGSLSAATTTAITSLKGKDWEININGTLQ